MKKFLTVFFVFTIYFNLSNQAYAGAAEKWTIEEVVYDNVAKNLTYTASKTGVAANDYIYKAKVPVTAAATGSTVASMIRMGLAGAAIYGIVEGVGWIIDEAGVVKKPVQSQEQLSEYLWTFNGYYANTAESLCRDKVPISSGYVYLKTVLTGPDDAECWVHHTAWNRDVLNYRFKRILNKDYVDTTTYVPVSDTELGAEVNKSPQAPEILPDVYDPNNPAGGDAPKSTSDALDSANPEPRTAPKSDTIKKPNKDTNGDGEPDVYDPTQPDAGESTAWPSACEWMPAVCEWFKWTKEPLEPPQKVNIPTTDLDEKSFLLNVITVNGAYCPANKVIDWDTPVGHFSKTVSYQNFCDATQWFGYLVLAASYYLGALIVVRDS